MAFSAVNLSVIKHYFIDAGEKNVLNNLVLPVIGFLLTVWLWTSLSGLTLVGRVDLAGGRILEVDEDRGDLVVVLDDHDPPSRRRASDFTSEAPSAVAPKFSGLRRTRRR